MVAVRIDPRVDYFVFPFNYAFSLAVSNPYDFAFNTVGKVSRYV